MVFIMDSRFIELLKTLWYSLDVLKEQEQDDLDTNLRMSFIKNLNMIRQGYSLWQMLDQTPMEVNSLSRILPLHGLIENIVYLGK